MKTIHLILLSCLTLSVGTTVYAGLRKSELEEIRKPVDKQLLTEARRAVYKQLINKLPYTIRGSAYSRRAVRPDPHYTTTFSTTSDTTSKHVSFVLKRQGLKEKKALEIGTGYYDPATKLVYLFSHKVKDFVEARKHMLLLANNNSKRASAILSQAAKR